MGEIRWTRELGQIEGVEPSTVVPDSDREDKLKAERSEMATYSNVKALTDKAYNLVLSKGPFAMERWVLSLGTIVEELSSGRFPMMSSSVRIPTDPNDVGNPNDGNAFQRGPQYRQRSHMETGRGRRDRPRGRTGGLSAQQRMELRQDHRTTEIHRSASQ